MRIGSVWLRIKYVEVFCECDNEFSGFMDVLGSFFQLSGFVFQEGFFHRVGYDSRRYNLIMFIV